MTINTLKSLAFHAFSTIMLTCLLAACIGEPERNFFPNQVANDNSRDFTASQILECRILSFTVDPPYGTHASDFTFTWQTENAKSVDLEPGLSYGLPANGSLKVTLYESNWIRLVARGPGGPVEEKIWVEAVWPGGSTWWKEHADEMNSGQSPYDGPQTGHLYWSRTFKGGLYGSPLIGEDGSVYVWSYNTLHCLSPQGHTKWINACIGHILAVLINPQGDIYVAAYDIIEQQSLLVKLHPNGLEMWRYVFPEFLFDEAALTLLPHGIVTLWTISRYDCVSWTGRTYLIDKNGGMITQFEHGDLYPLPALLLNTYFILVPTYSLQCLNFEGYQLWKNNDYYFRSHAVTSPEGVIYIETHVPSGTHSSLTAFDASGTLIWSFSELADGIVIEHIVTDIHGNLYFTANMGYTQCLYLISLDATGHLRWQFPLNDDFVESLAVDRSSTIYLTQRRSGVLAINQDGQFLWDYDLDHYFYPKCSLSMDETLYVINYDKLFAFRDDAKE